MDLFARTGLHLSARPSACKLEWYRENTPEASAWLGMAEYLIFRMTGQKGTDPSLAGRTMLFDIGRGERDERLGPSEFGMLEPGRGCTRERP